MHADSFPENIIKDPEEFGFVVSPETLKKLSDVEGWGVAIVTGGDVEFLLYPTDGASVASLVSRIGSLPTCPAMPWAESTAVIDYDREMDLFAQMVRHFGFNKTPNEGTAPVLPGFRPASLARQGDLAVKVSDFGIDVALTGDLARGGWLSGERGLALHISDNGKELALVRTEGGVSMAPTESGIETSHSIPGLQKPEATDSWIYPEYRIMGDALVFCLKNQKPDAASGPGDSDVKNPVSEFSGYRGGPKRGFFETILLLSLCAAGIATLAIFCLKVSFFDVFG